MKNLIGRLTILIFLAASVMASHGSAVAQIAAPQPIDTLISDRWRGPFETFLRELRVRDPSAVLEKTYALQIGGLRYADSILVRIENPALCNEDMCFTAVGRIVEGKFVADTMFVAGKRFTAGDEFVPLFGFQSRPLWIVGNKATVTLLETPKGWIVAPGPTLP